MRTSHVARLRAYLPLGVLVALAWGGRSWFDHPEPVRKLPPTAGDAGLFQYYTDIDRLLVAGREMDAALALGDAPGAPIRLEKARKLPLFAQGQTPRTLILRIADGLAQRAREAAALRRRDRARIYALHCRALALRLGAATSDAESQAVAVTVKRLAESAARAADS